MKEDGPVEKIELGIGMEVKDPIQDEFHIHVDPDGQRDHEAWSSCGKIEPDRCDMTIIEKGIRSIESLQS